jgi:acetyltransferase-like isoleucine patch superfamily enzyme
MRDFKHLILHGLFMLLYSFVKYIPLPFFEWSRFFVCKIFFKRLQSVKISDGVQFWFPYRISMGKNSSVNQGTIIDGYGKVNIGDNVRIGPYVVINSCDHKFEDLNIPIAEQGYVVGEVNIEDDVWIGSHVVVNKDVKIGKGCVIGSGAVVVSNLEPYGVYAGVPAKLIRKRNT